MSTEVTLPAAGPQVFGVPVIFLLFAAILVGVVVVHRRSLEVSLVGLALVVLLRLTDGTFNLRHHLAREWVMAANLLGLFVGFAQLADYFERSHLPEALLRVLPKGARGCFALLLLVWLLSGVVDNIAAAMIGATTAVRVFKNRLHLGYVVAIVACANAGGAGSVLGDTTTMMMWLEGVNPVRVLPAYTGALVALVIVGSVASLQQARYAAVEPSLSREVRIDVAHVAIVVVALVAVVAANVLGRIVLGVYVERIPLLALTLWTVLAAAAVVRPARWIVVPGAVKSGVFLVALVLSASLMPIQKLPRASTWTTLAIGVISAAFDNIPLTKLALDQGGYDCGLLAYAVGMGGSMLWFGSSAGVAVSNLFPSARSISHWARRGWHVPVAFLFGYLAQRGLHGWNP